MPLRCFTPLAWELGSTTWMAQRSELARFGSEGFWPAGIRTQERKGKGGDRVELSVRLLRHLRLDDQPDTNLIFSPLSLHAVLALLASAAVGATREQIVAFVGPAGADAHTTLTSMAVSGVLPSRRNDGWKPEVRCAMAVWVDASLRLYPAFADTAPSKFKARVP
ncbi:hypothetical protein E2562_009666 [Oryza meyeriana var. granulata]|uniref:Serpin domain-containing protein n=1 Tax=Oryza meyeriana var. granulata TaxID=110450 RepID=A0A6G1D2E3_9ORYZ|nr:hypothetical protein E2562_009666 [Oryza meyeriana var. granulata]